ncbi:hypothetical protein ACI7RC_26910 [Brevibacillus sp. B_LB10_24]
MTNIDHGETRKMGSLRSWHANKEAEMSDWAGVAKACVRSIFLVLPNRFQGKIP